MNDNRRRHDRVPGPFDGRRIGVLETPVQIHDLGEGGCFVNSLHNQKEGSQIILEIHLPCDGWIRLRGLTLYSRPGFGFAVRFTEVSESDRIRIQTALAKWQQPVS